MSEVKRLLGELTRYNETLAYKWWSEWRRELAGGARCPELRTGGRRTTDAEKALLMQLREAMAEERRVRYGLSKGK